MVSFEDFKKSLGELANKLSDEEINHLRDVSDRFADAVFDDWKKNLKVPNIVTEYENNN